MAERAVILAALMLVSCARPGNPERVDLDSDPCIDVEAKGGFEYSYGLDPGACMEMFPAEVMHGVWYTGFEESGFIADVETVPLHREMNSETPNPEFDTWLDIDEEEALSRLRLEPRPPGTLAIAITFVGRRSKPYRYRHGTPGMPVVVVDAVVGGRLIGRVTTRACFPGHRCVTIP